MTSTYTTNLAIEQPARGDDSGTWDVPVNADWALIDQASGTSTTVGFTNANVTLTVAQAAYFQIICTGSLTGNCQLILPSAIGGRRVIFNQCTGAFTLTVLNGAGDTGGGVVVGQGYQTPIVLTAGRAYYDAYASTPPGALLQYAGAATPPGFFLCYGQAVSRTTYAALFLALGTTWGTGDGSTTFNVPDLRGRLLAGADNMGGSAAGNLTGYVVGTTGGNQAVTLTTAQIPAHNHTDSGHVHTISDPGHSHVSIVPPPLGTSGGGFTFNAYGSGLTGVSTTGITINSGAANIQNTGGGGSHTNVQPTAAINMLIRY